MSTIFTTEDWKDMMAAENKKTNEKGEYIFTNAAFERFKKENDTTFQIINSKSDDTRFAIANVGIEKVTKKDIIGVIRLQKQIHSKTGETAKVVSGKAPDGTRYKVIYVKSKDRYEIWSHKEGKRKCEAREKDKEVILAKYEEFMKGSKKTEKRSA